MSKVFIKKKLFYSTSLVFSLLSKFNSLDNLASRENFSSWKPSSIYIKNKTTKVLFPPFTPQLQSLIYPPSKKNKNNA